MEFRELSDEQWAFLQPLRPPKARTGRPRADDRKTLNGILYVLTTGCRWLDRPAKDSSYQTAWRKLSEVLQRDAPQEGNRIECPVGRHNLPQACPLGHGRMDAVAG